MYRFVQRLILFLVGFSLPMQGFSLNLAGYPMTPSKIVAGLLAVLVVLKFALTGDRRLPRDPARAALAIFTISTLISGIVSVVDGMHPIVAFVASLRYFLLVAFYLMLSYVIRTRDDLVLVLWALALGGGVTALPALLQIRAGTYLSAVHRAQGLAGQPNTLGYELAICLAVAAGLYFVSRSRLRRYLLLGSAGLMLVAIVGSLSRGTYLSLAAMWAFWVWRAGRLDTLKYVVPVGAAALVFVLFFLPAQVQERIDTMVDPAQRAEDRSINSRVLQAGWAMQALASNPITGVGVGNFVSWSQRQPGGKMLHNSVHSMYFHLLAGHGLLGFLPFVAILVLAWTRFSTIQRMARVRRSRGDPTLRELGNFALVFQVALVGAAIGGVGQETSDSKGLWALLAFAPVTLALVRVRAREIDGSLEATGGVDSHPRPYPPAGDVAIATR